MCGISGFISKNRSVNINLFSSAHDLIGHRGPDDEGYVCLQNNVLSPYKGNGTVPFFDYLPHINEANNVELCFAQKRLSIIDLTENGHQPLLSKNKDFCLAFNGEIFNYIELRNSLIKEGVEFKTNSDTEVVIEAYIKYGTDCFSMFNGMWAIAIYDVKKQEIVISRDRFGIKPFYYSIKNDTLIFSSENKVVKKALGSPLTLNQNSVLKYLNNNVLDDSEETFWHEIKELEPATFIKFNGKIIAQKTFWEPTPNQEIKDFDYAINQLESIFEDSMKLRMRSDVEVGSLLSGGLDSTTIVCSLEKQGLLNNKFQAFSAVYDNQKFSEKKYIDDTTKALNLKTNFVYPTASEIESYMDKILFHIETPFRSLSVFSQYKLYENISSSSNIKVLLNGQGADEIFGGYSYHYYHLFADYLSQLRFRKFIYELKLLKKERGVSNFKVMKNMLVPLLNATFKKDYFSKFNAYEVAHTPLREYLKYDDRTSMAFGIETRPPFLDHRLVNFALSLDNKFKIDEFENKKILRAYAKDIIPKSVLNRKDKMGFVSPQESWQKNELLNSFDSIFSEIKNNKVFDSVNTNKLTKSYEDYKKGKHNNWTYIWRIYCLAKWGKLN